LIKALGSRIFSFPLGWLTFIGIRLLVKLESPEKKGGREKEMPVEERGRERKAREGNSNEGGPKAVSVKYKTSLQKSRMAFIETPTPTWSIAKNTVQSGFCEIHASVPGADPSRWAWQGQHL